MENNTIIKIEQLEKSFGALHVLKGINLEIHQGEVVCIIGASGSGKSTLLRCINLLEEADSGHIWFDGPLRESERPAAEDRHGVPGLQPVQQQIRAG